MNWEEVLKRLLELRSELSAMCNLDNHVNGFTQALPHCQPLKPGTLTKGRGGEGRKQKHANEQEP